MNKKIVHNTSNKSDSTAFKFKDAQTKLNSKFNLNINNQLTPLATHIFSSISAVATKVNAIKSNNQTNKQNPHYNPNKMHHAPKGFKNIYSNAQPTPKQIAGWLWYKYFGDNVQQRAQDNLDLKPLSATQLNQIQHPQHAQITWIGHSTCLIQTPSFNIITDPIFSNFASPVQNIGPKRLQPPALNLQQLPQIDAVLVSHNHYDHLDYNSIKQLYKNQTNAHFYVPLGVEEWFIKHISKGDMSRIHGLDWWDTYQQNDDLAISFVPAQHWSNRTLFSQFKTLWGGFVVTAQSKSVYFAGDTAYEPHYFKQIGQQFNIDMALIPVGAYEPRWFMRFNHINEAEAVQIFKDLKAKKALAIHWGTFQLTNEAPDAPTRVLPKVLVDNNIAAEAFVIKKHGVTTPY